jgi:hypothetical protein
MSTRKYPKDEPVPDHNIEPDEYLNERSDGQCIYCGHKRCVCDDRYEDYVEKHRKE